MVSLPEHRQDEDREVGARGDGEGQTDHEGDVLLLEGDAEHDRQDAQGDGRDLRDAHFLLLVGPAAAEHRGVEVMADRRGARQRQAGHDRQDGGEGDGRDEAEEQIAADRLGQVDRRHVGAAHHVGERVDRAVGTGLEERRIVHQQDDGAEADDEGQDVEVADEAGGVEDRLAGFLGVGDGEEAHQDVRQAGRAEHQRQPSEIAEIGSVTSVARLHDGEMLRVHVDRGLEQCVEVEAEVRPAP